LTQADVIDWCRSHLASFKKPSEVHFLEVLPKSGYGKILKRETREMIMSTMVGQADFNQKIASEKKMTLENKTIGGK
jgi:acyl-CoA synthetase (AMP-forming)/AMP-acid ligase II